eukprot:2395818-Amphidinium_carterae.1
MVQCKQEDVRRNLRPTSLMLQVRLSLLPAAAWRYKDAEHSRWQGGTKDLGAKMLELKRKGRDFLLLSDFEVKFARVNSVVLAGWGVPPVRVLKYPRIGAETVSIANSAGALDQKQSFLQ